MTVATPSTDAHAQAPGWEALISQVLARRGKPGQGGYTADLRRGISPLTRRFALPHVGRYLTGATRAESDALILAAAITAEHDRAPHKGGTPLGRSFAVLHQRWYGKRPHGDLNSITTRVTLLPSLALEEAAQTIDALVGMCADKHVAVDYYALTRTLTRWGGGATSESRHVRERIAYDMFSTSPEE
jgi:CRISPR type I-E-associated protein CasB/Cse2